MHGAPRVAEAGRRAIAVGGLVLLAVGCSADRIERGVFHSTKGYRVSLPREGWTVERGGPADIELRRATPVGGMLASATCDGRAPTRPLPVLARHLVFGLEKREPVASGTLTAGGLPGTWQVLHGRAAAEPVAVEAVVLKGPRCVYDFLYVAPTAAFEAGRADFRTFVESLTTEGG